MCSLCASCSTRCYCPRCPFRKGELLGWPPAIQPCIVCGMADNRECKDPVCAVTEHFLYTDQPYCQMCVEATHPTRFPGQQLAMYCKGHEEEHKNRMFTAVSFVARHFDE